MSAAKLTVYLCSVADELLTYRDTLQAWFREHGFQTLTSSDDIERKLRAAQQCDLCIVLLGGEPGSRRQESLFADVELEVSTAIDANASKVLVFSAASTTSPATEDQREFIERLRNFHSGTFQSTFTAQQELVAQVQQSLQTWQPQAALEQPAPILAPENAVMISSTSDLTPTRQFVHRWLEAHQYPVIDYLSSTSEVVSPLERVLSWARECRVLVLLLDEHYGYISPIDGFGVTELEFVTALRAGRSIIAYLGSQAQRIINTPLSHLSSADVDQRQFIERVQSFIPGELIKPYQDDTSLQLALEEGMRLAQRTQALHIASPTTETALRWYRRQLERWLGATPNLFSTHEITLAQVYEHIDVQTQEQARLAAQRYQEQTNILFPLRQRVERWEHKPIASHSLSKILTQSPHILLTGGAGAGKSTTLRWLALTASDQDMPIFVRLPRFAQALRQREVATLFDMLLAEERRLVLNADPGSSQWRQTLLDGKGLILLDALDEVPEQEQEKIQDAIRAFAKQVPSNTRIVVSSRNVVSKLDSWPIFVLAALSDEQRDVLARNWFKATHPAPKDEMVATFMNEFQGLLKHHNWKDWIRTPLLVTLVALLLDQTQDVEHLKTLTQVDVYRRVSRLLLSRWRTVNLQSGKWHLVQKERFLLALSGYEGIMSLQDCRRLWRRYQKQYQEDLTIEQLLGELADRDGILSRTGNTAFAFFHASFHDYFDARLTAWRLASKVKKHPLPRLLRKHSLAIIPADDTNTMAMNVLAEDQPNNQADLPRRAFKDILKQRRWIDTTIIAHKLSQLTLVVLSVLAAFIIIIPALFVFGRDYFPRFHAWADVWPVMQLMYHDATNATRIDVFMSSYIAKIHALKDVWPTAQVLFHDSIHAITHVDWKTTPIASYVFDKPFPWNIVLLVAIIFVIIGRSIGEWLDENGIDSDNLTAFYVYDIIDNQGFSPWMLCTRWSMLPLISDFASLSVVIADDPNDCKDRLLQYKNAGFPLPSMITHCMAQQWRYDDEESVSRNFKIFGSFLLLPMRLGRLIPQCLRQWRQLNKAYNQGDSYSAVA